MLLGDISRDLTVARRYMERYVNDGSPSGFTERHTSSAETSPFGVVPHFRLWSASVPDECIEDIGTIPEWIGAGNILLHPDMVTEPPFATDSARVELTNIRVTPTASARTVEVIDPPSGIYAKLHYDALLGRVNRRLTRSHACAALDVNAILRRAISEDALPPLFAFLPESSARVAILRTPDGAALEWGTVFREVEPQPRLKATTFLIPAFSLFSADRNNATDPPLLAQLAALRSMSIGGYTYENSAKPIVCCYFELLLRFALQFECNAQNIILGFDEHGSISTVIFRDFESVDKDISLADDLNLSVTFSSYPFKCVHRELYNYSIKHSFMRSE